MLQVVLAAAFLGMGALPKLTGDPMVVELFELLGAPWARVVVGVIEIVAAILLVIPRTAVYGGIAAILAMLGAIASHLGPLGIMPELTDPETGEKGPVRCPVGSGASFLLEQQTLQRAGRCQERLQAGSVAARDGGKIGCSLQGRVFSQYSLDIGSIQGRQQQDEVAVSGLGN